MAINVLRSLPSFDAPLELLGACHDNVRRFTGQLAHLSTLNPASLQSAAAIAMATQIVRYFDQAAPHHHADEEDDLFPALLLLGDVSLSQKIELLYQQHQQMAQAWKNLRPQLLALQAGQNADLTAAADFCRLYEHHAQFEDEQVYPHATQLGPDILADLGQRMSARRRTPGA